MPTVTTTVTSACASGAVTTQTTTEATPEASSSSSSKDVVLSQAIIEAWATNTLADNVTTYYAEDAVADWGSGAINGPTFIKYTGHAAIAKWIRHLADYDVTKFDTTYSAQEGGGCYIHLDWSFIVKSTGKSYGGNDIIHYTFNGAGKATAMTMFWTNPKAIEEAHAQEFDPVAAAMKVLNAWEAGTLIADIPDLVDPDVVADWGSDAINLPSYRKYKGHAEFAEWLGNINNELDFTKFERHHTPGPANGCFIHIDWTVVVKSTGKEFSSKDIIYYTFNAAGKATSITMYWTNTSGLEAAYSA